MTEFEESVYNDIVRWASSYYQNAYSESYIKERLKHFAKMYWEYQLT